MKKDLPGVFPGNVNSNAGNNSKVSYGDKEDRSTPTTKEVVKEININQKLNQIFNSSNYIYKADVEIKLKDGSKLNKRIIGKNNIHLITMNNELIPITDIIDIERK